MSGETVQAAILFADIAGSTRLYNERGNAFAQKAVGVCLEYLNSITLNHGGRKIKTIGDEIMCRFASADAAVMAAMDMQRGIAQVPPGLEIPLQIKIGVHFGPMLESDDDVFGDAVNIAARMASIARANQIITTESTVRELNSEIRQATRPFDAAPVKGIRGLVHICEVIWEAHNVTAMLSTPVTGLGIDAGSLRLKWRDLSFIIRAGDSACVLGREQGCSFLLPSEYASRRHASIEHRRGKFILIDQSTNGTYLRLDGDNTSSDMYLRREEMPLLGFGGTIGLGAALDAHPEYAIRFDCI